MQKIFCAMVAAALSIPVAAQVNPIPYVSIQAANIQYGELLKSNIGGTRGRTSARASAYGTHAPGRAVAVAAPGIDYFTSPAPTGSVPVAFRYDSTPELQKAAVADYVARVAKSNSSAAATVGSELTRHNPSKIYAGIVKPFGYRADDAADALAAYTLLGWLVATGSPDPSPHAAAGVRAQIGARAGSNPSFTNQADRAKLGEELKLLFVTLHAGWQSARREGTLKQYSDGVAELFRNQGTDLRRLRLTDQGLVGG